MSPRWLRIATAVLAVVCMIAAIIVGYRGAGDHRAVLTWGSGIWVAAQGLFTVGDLTLGAQGGLKDAWEIVTKPVIALVGMTVFGYAAGTAGNEANLGVLVGLFVLIAVLYSIAKFVQKRLQPMTAVTAQQSGATGVVGAAANQP